MYVCIYIYTYTCIVFTSNAQEIREGKMVIFISLNHFQQLTNIEAFIVFTSVFTLMYSPLELAFD